MNPNLTQQHLTASQVEKPSLVGHPKMTKLEEVVLDHFNKMSAGEQTDISAVFFLQI